MPLPQLLGAFPSKDLYLWVTHFGGLTAGTLKPLCPHKQTLGCAYEFSPTLASCFLFLPLPVAFSQWPSIKAQCACCELVNLHSGALLWYQTKAGNFPEIVILVGSFSFPSMLSPLLEEWGGIFKINPFLTDFHFKVYFRGTQPKTKIDLGFHIWPTALLLCFTFMIHLLVSTSYNYSTLSPQGSALALE